MKSDMWGLRKLEIPIGKRVVCKRRLFVNNIFLHILIISNYSLIRPLSIESFSFDKVILADLAFSLLNFLFSLLLESYDVYA